MNGLLALGLAVSLAACGGKGSPSAPSAGGDDGGTGAFGDAAETPTTPAIPPMAGVATIVDRKSLVLSDGKAIALDPIEGGGLGGYQTKDGWLVRGYGNGSNTLSLWLVKPDGTLKKLIEKAEAPVAVAPDGRHFAWRSGGRLYTGHLDASLGVPVDKSSPGPTRGAPISLTNDAVVIGYSETGGGIDHHDTWIPSLGDYKPTFEKTTQVRAVFGPAPGSNTFAFLGLVQDSSGTCIAEMNAKDSLKPTKTACGLKPLVDRFGAVSPDGHWLAVHTADASGRGVIAVVDLTSVFTKPAITISWNSDAVGAWEDASTMLVPADASGGGLVRFHLGAVGSDAVPRTGITKESRLDLLPRLV